MRNKLKIIILTAFLMGVGYFCYAAKEKEVPTEKVLKHLDSADGLNVYELTHKGQAYLIFDKKYYMVIVNGTNVTGVAK